MIIENASLYVTAEAGGRHSKRQRSRPPRSAAYLKGIENREFATVKDEVTRWNRSAILFNSRFQDDVHFQKKKIIAPVRQLLRAPYVASRDNILSRCLLEHWPDLT